MKRIYNITEQYISTITYTVQVDSAIDDKAMPDPIARAKAQQLVQDQDTIGEEEKCEAFAGILGSGDFETDFQSGKIISVDEITRGIDVSILHAN